MKLVYAWMLDKDREDEISFNLGSKLIYQYNNKIKKLSYEENPNYISNFFKTINNNEAICIDFAAIVGENGVGKTKLLEMLHIAITKISGSGLIIENIENPFLLIFEEDNKRKIFYSGKLDDIDTTLVFSNWSKKENVENNEYRCNNISSFIISNVFDAKITLPDRNFTTNTLLYEASLKAISKEDNLTSIKDVYSKYKYNELKKQIKLFNIVQHSKNKEFVFPKLLSFSIKSDAEMFESLSALLFQTSDGKVSIEYHLNFKIDSEEHMIQKFFSENSTYNRVVSDCYRIIQILGHVLNSRKTPLIRIKTFHNNIKITIEKHDNFVKFIQSIMELLERLGEENRNQLSQNFFKGVKTLQRLLLETLKLAEKLTIDAIDITKIDLISDHTDVLDVVFFSRESIYNLSWKGYSSGEIALLNMLTRIHTCIDKNRLSNSIILIDEADLYFHPQLQKKFIDIVINFTNILNESYSRRLKVQFILTTHSPFLVSDLPSDRILFMYIDEKGKRIGDSKLEHIPNTFGANIHDLYAHSFFLKGGLMGEFAKKKINEIANSLINFVPGSSNLNFDKILKEINLVGEPILRRRLFELYEEKKYLPDQQQIRSDIDALKKQISELEKELKKNSDNDK